MSLESEMSAVLVAPLANLVDVGAQVRLGPVVDGWALPDPDRQALRNFGLPSGPLLRPHPQADAVPALAPSVAGDLERRLIEADRRLYLLGSYGAELTIGEGDLTLRVGAAVDTGQVLGIRSRPLTTEDIHPQLRELHRGLYRPAVCFFNSSVASFVGTAWRWYAAVEVLRRHPGPHLTAPAEEHEAYFDRVQRCREQFLAGLTNVDKALGDERSESVWVETITDDY